jgi:protein-L-isoaspartate O-methyltransferase
MRDYVQLSDEAMVALDLYRQTHKAETGRMITRARAASDIIVAHCEGIEPPKALYKRLEDLTERVRSLENSL